MAHTVTITRLPDETSDDYEYTFAGECDGTCMVGKRCPSAECQAVEHDEDDLHAHGQYHWWNYDNAEWIVHDTEDCALHHAFEMVTEDETFEGLTLGTYPVLVMWEDSWWLEVQQ